MNFELRLLSRSHRLGLHWPWIAATRGVGQVPDDQVLNLNIAELCETIKRFIDSRSTDPKKRMALSMSAKLTNGVVRILFKRATLIYDEAMQESMRILKCAIVELELSPQPEPKKKRPKKKITQPRVEEAEISHLWDLPIAPAEEEVDGVITAPVTVPEHVITMRDFDDIPASRPEQISDDYLPLGPPTAEHEQWTQELIQSNRRFHGLDTEPQPVEGTQPQPVEGTQPQPVEGTQETVVPIAQTELPVVATPRQTKRKASVKRSREKAPVIRQPLLEFALNIPRYNVTGIFEEGELEELRKALTTPSGSRSAGTGFSGVVVAGEASGSAVQAPSAYVADGTDKSTLMPPPPIQSPRPFDLSRPSTSREAFQPYKVVETIIVPVAAAEIQKIVEVSEAPVAPPIAATTSEEARRGFETSDVQWKKRIIRIVEKFDFRQRELTPVVLCSEMMGEPLTRKNMAHLFGLLLELYCQGILDLHNEPNSTDLRSLTKGPKF